MGHIKKAHKHMSFLRLKCINSYYHVSVWMLQIHFLHDLKTKRNIDSGVEWEQETEIKYQRFTSKFK